MSAREKKVPEGKAMSKSELASELASKVELSKAQVSKLLDAMADLADKEMHRAGAFTVPGIVKVQAKLRAATKSRPGRNPKTGETITISAKPARIVLRGRVLKPLKKSWE